MILTSQIGTVKSRIGFVTIGAVAYTPPPTRGIVSPGTRLSASLKPGSRGAPTLRPGSAG